MRPITMIEMLVLSAASDDYENLEQVYRSLALEFSAENYDPSNPKSFYWREAAQAPSLSEIANAIRQLTVDGLLEGRMEDGSPIVTLHDPSLVWQGWFRTTETGLNLLQNSVREEKGSG